MTALQTQTTPDHQNLVTQAQMRAEKCKLICDEVLQSNDIDKIATFAENCKQAIYQMQSNRKPITSKFDEIKKLFTTSENMVEAERLRAMAKISEIKTAKAKELLKQKEIETYEVRILDHLKAYCTTFALNMNKALEEVNEHNLEQKKATLSTVRFTYDRRHFNSFNHIAGIDLDAKYNELNEIFKADMDRLRAEMLTLMNDVKLEFKATEIAKVDKIKEHLIKEDAPDLGKAYYQVQMLSVSAALDLFIFWFDEEGKSKNAADIMTMSIDRMKAFAEKMANKGVFIDSPDTIKYNEYYK